MELWAILSFKKLFPLKRYKNGTIEKMLIAETFELLSSATNTLVLEPQCKHTHKTL